jgi:ketosteroid isomerase-like protein
MSRENIEIVRNAYDVALAQRGVAGVMNRFAADFTWHQRAEWPGRPTFGASEMPQLWADLDETYSDMNLVPVEFVDVGEYVVVTVESSSRLRGSDARLESRLWHVWHLWDGLALEGWAFRTRLEAFETAGQSGVSK